MSADLWTPDRVWDELSPHIRDGAIALADRFTFMKAGAQGQAWASRWWEMFVGLCEERSRAGAVEHDFGFWRHPPTVYALEYEALMELADGAVYMAMKARTLSLADA